MPGLRPRPRADDAAAREPRHATPGGPGHAKVRDAATLVEGRPTGLIVGPRRLVTVASDFAGDQARAGHLPAASSGIPIGSFEHDGVSGKAGPCRRQGRSPATRGSIEVRASSAG